MSRRDDLLRAKRGRETDTVQAILSFLRLHRIPAWRMNTGATKIGSRFIRFGSPGMADVIGIVPCCKDGTVMEAGRLAGYGSFVLGNPVGRFLAIEVKSAKGKVSDAQYAFAKTVTDAGGLCVLARSVDDVARALSLPTSGQP